MDPPTPHRNRPTRSASNDGAQADTAAPSRLERDAEQHRRPHPEALGDPARRDVGDAVAGDERADDDADLRERQVHLPDDAAEGRDDAEPVQRELEEGDEDDGERHPPIVHGIPPAPDHLRVVLWRVNRLRYAAFSLRRIFDISAKNGMNSPCTSLPLNSP